MTGFLSCLMGAWLMGAQPDPGALAPLYRENLARIEREFGARHEKTLAARRDLALFLIRFGDKREGAELLKSAARSADDYAQLAELSPPVEAVGLLRIALAKQEQESGADHPRVALRLNDLALALPPREAEPLLRRAVTINEKALGAEHLETAATLNNLADTLATMRRYKEALPLAERSARILRTALGAESERTKTAEANLAAIRQRVPR
ncbi:MAG: tetratricopeptide repeat protein [Bryobacteraceae bacterium]|nr:tetratricopeptide repeat protein [Bryobacteraceae bacterium]